MALILNNFNYKYIRYFENLAIGILDLFDKNESDYFNDNLLLTKNSNFSVHLLSFANTAKCENFMATKSAQKSLDGILIYKVLVKATSSSYK